MPYSWSLLLQERRHRALTMAHFVLAGDLVWEAVHVADGVAGGAVGVVIDVVAAADDGPHKESVVAAGDVEVVATDS